MIDGLGTSYFMGFQDLKKGWGQSLNYELPLFSVRTAEKPKYIFYENFNS
jgi:hypothetical protein